MKAFILAALLLTTANADFLQDDKKKHMAVGAAIYYSCVGLGNLYQKHDIDWMNRSMCWTVNLAVAGLKELYDSKGHGVADANDIFAQIAVPSVDVVVFSWGSETDEKERVKALEIKG